MHRSAAFASRVHRLMRLNRAGAVAIVTAACAPVLIMIAGFVADFGYASYINQCLARATDAATLASVSQTAATAAGGYGNTASMQAMGVNFFNANAAAVSASGVKFSLSVVSDGSGGVIATGNYSYNVPTFFAGILGFGNIPVSGSAKTTARPLVYVNYYILVDTSQSMGIASTPAGMSSLYNLVASTKNQSSGGEAGCVFGCHVTTGSQQQSNETLAHRNNIELRIDAAITAVKSIITQAQSIAGVTKNIVFGLYAIQQDPATNLGIHLVASPSTDYASLLNAASTIDLGNNNAGGTGDTDFPSELGAFNYMLTQAGVTSNGSGASATSPLNYYLIVTDGVTDVAGGCPYGHCTGPINTSYCTTLKTKGTVGVIYTTYAPIWDSNNPGAGVLEAAYRDLVNPFASQIAPALQSCATSSDFYFEANDGPDIIAAVQALFARTQPSSARIAQ